MTLSVSQTFQIYHMQDYLFFILSVSNSQINTFKFKGIRMFIEISPNSKEITCARVSFFRHVCSPVNLLHIFRTSFPKNTSGLLLDPVKNL